MDAHRVKVLDGANDDAVVRLVANHLHLELFPADEAFLDQQFLGGREVEPALADFLELVGVVGDAAPGPAQGEAGSDHHRKARPFDLGRDLLLHSQGFFHRMGDAAARRTQADTGHGVLELQPILGLFNGLFVGADHLDAVLGEHTMLVQVQRAIQGSLATHRWQHRVGTLLGDDLFDHLPGDGLDVGRIGHLRVGHDRRRVAVDEDEAVALFAQRLAGLGSRVIEFAGLANDDRASPDDENGAKVGALRHLHLRSRRREQSASAQ